MGRLLPRIVGMALFLHSVLGHLSTSHEQGPRLTTPAVRASEMILLQNAGSMVISQILCGYFLKLKFRSLTRQAECKRHRRPVSPIMTMDSNVCNETVAG